MNTAIRILIVMAILVPFWWGVAREAGKFDQTDNDKLPGQVRRMGRKLHLAIVATIVVAFGAAIGAVSSERGGAEELRDGQGYEYR